MSHIPISRDGVKHWCTQAFEAGMTAQSKREGTPQQAFDAWWESMAGADKRRATTRARAEKAK